MRIEKENSKRTFFSIQQLKKLKNNIYLLSRKVESYTYIYMMFWQTLHIEHKNYSKSHTLWLFSNISNIFRKQKNLFFYIFKTFTIK